jgi:hypothetical protein
MDDWEEEDLEDVPLYGMTINLTRMNMKKIIVLTEYEYSELCRLCRLHCEYKDSEGKELRAIIRLIAYRLEAEIQLMGKDEDQ